MTPYRQSVVCTPAIHDLESMKSELPKIIARIEDISYTTISISIGISLVHSSGVPVCSTGRCPSDYNILLNYIGGSRDPAIGIAWKNRILFDAVDVDLRKVL